MGLVATVGDAAANSYVLRQDADDFFQLGMHPKSETWHVIADELRDQYLIRATYQIDMQKIRGGKADSMLDGSGVPNQALKFPRSQDDDGGTSYIPIEIKRATYEQAVYLAETGSQFDTRALLQAQGVTSVSIDDVSESYGGGGTSTLDVLAPIVKQLLLDGGFVVRAGAWQK